MAATAVLPSHASLDHIDFQLCKKSLTLFTQVTVLSSNDLFFVMALPIKIPQTIRRSTAFLLGVDSETSIPAAAVGGIP